MLPEPGNLPRSGQVCIIGDIERIWRGVDQAHVCSSIFSFCRVKELAVPTACMTYPRPQRPRTWRQGGIDGPVEAAAAEPMFADSERCEIRQCHSV